MMLITITRYNNYIITDFYNITNSHGKVARFCMFKQAYRIGDDIVATCDFSESNVPCVQVCFTPYVLYVTFKAAIK